MDKQENFPKISQEQAYLILEDINLHSFVEVYGIDHQGWIVPLQSSGALGEFKSFAVKASMKEFVDIFL